MNSRIMMSSKQRRTLLLVLENIKVSVRALNISLSEDAKLVNSLLFIIDELALLIRNKENLPVYFPVIDADNKDADNKELDLLKQSISLESLLETGESLNPFRDILEDYKIQIKAYLQYINGTISLPLNSIEERLFSLERELTETIGAYKMQVEELKEEKDKQKAKISDINTEISTKSDNLTKLTDDHRIIQDDLDKLKSKLQGRVKYLDSLIGKEVGVSLFRTFAQRKKELNVSVVFWIVLVFITAGGTGYFISKIFVNIGANSIPWSDYVAYTIKLIPFFIILFFCIRQYQRERNFQEEYAFKSSVALTIYAYSKQIEDKNKRDDMIIDSVSKVYDSPIAKHLSKEKIKTQSVLKGIEVMKDTVTGVTKDVVEITKKTK